MTGRLVAGLGSAVAICLVVRRPRWALLLLGPLLGVGDYLNASAMLRGIRRRSRRGS